MLFNSTVETTFSGLVGKCNLEKKGTIVIVKTDGMKNTYSPLNYKLQNKII